MTDSKCFITELNASYLDALVIAVHRADAGCAAQVTWSSWTGRFLRWSSRICRGNMVVFSIWVVCEGISHNVGDKHNTSKEINIDVKKCARNLKLSVSQIIPYYQKEQKWTNVKKNISSKS